jgi:hypothetical protein
MGTNLITASQDSKGNQKIQCFKRVGLGTAQCTWPGCCDIEIKNKIQRAPYAVLECVNFQKDLLNEI